MTMHLLNLDNHQVHDDEEDEKQGQHEDSHPTKCSHCGRQLMERKGVLRQLKPISNAFVVHGNCLACHAKAEGGGASNGKE
mmetsp:Transcript_25824/g.46792  ORF Transcript_25824/g.46792 Transcript_25824/m.46792 type:complete len:81 (-) Transcript_25824:53-295(-)